MGTKGTLYDIKGTSYDIKGTSYDIGGREKVEDEYVQSNGEMGGRRWREAMPSYFSVM